MNSKQLLAAAVMTGLMIGVQARAEDSKMAGQAGAATEKNHCCKDMTGPEKKVCMAKLAKMKKGKNGCHGANGCSQDKKDAAAPSTEPAK